MLSEICSHRCDIGQRAESDPPVGASSWPWIILVDSDPTRGRRRRIALTRCGFPAVDVVRDVSVGALVTLPVQVRVGAGDDVVA